MTSSEKEIVFFTAFCGLLIGVLVIFSSIADTENSGFCESKGLRYSSSTYQSACIDKSGRMYLIRYMRSSDETKKKKQARDIWNAENACAPGQTYFAENGQRRTAKPGSDCGGK